MTFTRLSRYAILIGIASLLSATNGAPARADDRPNVLWITIEDWSPDLSCYGTKGIHTPHVDQLAAQGIRYERAFTTSPVCSTSRSAMMTGFHQNYIGAHQHRTDDKKPLPHGIRPIPHLLADAGYYTCLMSWKTDCNFLPDKREELFMGTDWKGRKPGQPFFARITFGGTHRPWKRDPQRPIDIKDVELPPYYPDTPFVRHDWANGLEAMQLVDREVGGILKRLEKEGLADNTIVFFIADHGRCHIRGKQFLYDEGTRIPMIVRWPGKIKPGHVSDDRPLPKTFESLAIPIFTQKTNGRPMISFKRKLICLLSVAVVFVSSLHMEAGADTSPWTNANRIAISADGNPDADADDVGATPFTLAVLAKAGLQDNLVHFDFNNFLNYKKIDADNNRMWLSAMGGQARWGFGRNRFFDASLDPGGAVEHLTSVINKSTDKDPLYLIVGGPMELIYRALEAADSSARQHVKLVSHHNYNEYFKPRLWHRNWNDVKALVPEIGYLRSKDQNGNNGTGLKGTDNSDFSWLQNHPDRNLNWVYERIVAGKPDVSDAGMLTWLIGINGEDEVVTIPEMQAWFGTGIVPENGGSPTTPAAPAGVTPGVVPPATQSIFKEVDGKLVMEAESVPLTEDWILETTESDYSGSGYIRWMPKSINEISHQHEGVLLYKLRISNPGKYRMALRSSHKGAPARDKWNDCWTLIGLNPVHPYGMTRKTYHSINQEQFDSGLGFTWHTTHDNYGAVANQEGHFSTPIYDLTAGDHYFWICGRSGGFRIDKIHFFKEGVAGFKSDQEPTTPILTGSDR